MSGTSPLGFSIDPLQILGFGFIGLAFLMAILAYRSLKDVIAAPNPRQDVIKLARLFMYLSLALLIAAGPLQLGLLWAQSTFAPKPVNLKISLVNPSWDEELFGKVHFIVNNNGDLETLQKLKPVTRAVDNNSKLQLQMEDVINKIEDMRVQLRVVKEEKDQASLANSALPAIPDAATQALEGG